MPLFMDGSSSSKSYMVIARRGKIVLGIKAAQIVNGAAMKLPGNAVILLNLRAAPMDAQLEEVFEIGEQKVVSIGHALDHKTAFPEIEFAKVSDERCSVVVYLPFKESPAQNKISGTLARLASTKEIEEAATKLLARVGEGVVVTPSELAGFIKETLNITPAHADEIATKAKMTEEIADAVSGEVLVGGVMTAKLKEIVQKYQGKNVLGDLDEHESEGMQA